MFNIAQKLTSVGLVSLVLHRCFLKLPARLPVEKTDLALAGPMTAVLRPSETRTEGWGWNGGSRLLEKPLWERHQKVGETTPGRTKDCWGLDDKDGPTPNPPLPAQRIVKFDLFLSFLPRDTHVTVVTLRYDSNSATCCICGKKNKSSVQVRWEGTFTVTVTTGVHVE